MRAITLTRFGGVDAFSVTGVPNPYPSGHEVVIRVEATSVNPVDYKIRDGRAKFLAPKLPTILHPDCSGVVTEVGAQVESLNVGDRVMAFASGLMGKDGALAEFMAADSRMVAKIPEDLSFRAAAALPLVSVTSWYAMVEAASAQPGMSVLVMGGTGGVGHVAIQLAKWKGAHVVAVCGSYQKCEIAKRLGADDAVNYKSIPKDDYYALAPGGEGFDVVFNTPGAPSINQSVAAAKFGGKIIDILGDFPTEAGFQIKWLSFVSIFAGHEIVFATNPAKIGEILESISDLTAQGFLTPLVDSKRFGMTEVGLAHEYLESGAATGKVVLTQDLPSFQTG